MTKDTRPHVWVLTSGHGGWGGSAGIHYFFLLYSESQSLYFIGVHYRHLNMEKIIIQNMCTHNQGWKEQQNLQQIKSCAQFKLSPASPLNSTSLVELYTKNCDKTACISRTCARHPVPTLLHTIIRPSPFSNPRALRKQKRRICYP